MNDILIVSGTRPELIKLAPLALALKRAGVSFRHVFTGQHTGLATLTMRWDVLTTLFDPRTTLFLGLPSENRPERYAQETYGELLLALEGQQEPKLVLVQGDTASALAGGRYAAARELPLAHLEAGLRTFDSEDPWPEEVFRVEIDHLAHLRLAPTPKALGNLLAENLEHGSFEVGNTIVDALALAGVNPVPPGRRATRLLVTLHRRESFGAPLRVVAEGLAAFARRHGQLEVLWPMHPNPRVQESLDGLTLPPNVRVLGPLPYFDFVTLLAGSRAVLTDSGGVVEEAATLGVPAVIARRKTERMEAVESRQAKLAGFEANAVSEALGEALGGGLRSSPSCVFGDGQSATRCCRILQEKLETGSW